MRIDDNRETKLRKLLRERPAGIPADRDPAARRQFDDAARRVQRQRLARKRRKQLVVGAEPLRCARSEQDGGDIAGVDHGDETQGKTRMIATTPADILRFVQARTGEGRATVLVTLTAIEGSSPRAIGAQMAVAEDGQYAGSFSGGCIEAAVVAEAIGTLADGHARLVRFGAGSPYLDIRLPCGGGIDLLFNPRPDPRAIAEALARHDRREVAELQLSEDGVHPGIWAGERGLVGWNRDSFHVRYLPRLRIVAMGQGEELLALARLGAAFGADIGVVTPDGRALAELEAGGFDAVRLATRTTLPPIATDPWTAILSVFHDRDWEEELLPRALHLPAFYIGAIGSRRTQELRRDALREAGLSEHIRRKLRTSVGLIPATRDPATLALSALSEIVQEYNRIGGAIADVEDERRRCAADADLVQGETLPGLA